MVDSLASAEVTWAEHGRHVEGIEGKIVGVMSEDVVEHIVLLTLLLGENVWAHSRPSLKVSVSRFEEQALPVRRSALIREHSCACIRWAD